MIRNIIKHRVFLTIVGFFVVSFLIFLLLLILRYEKNIENSMFNVSTSDLFKITQNKASHIKHLLGETKSNYIDTLKSDPLLRDRIESCVKNILTDNIKYAYILYKDKNDVFRFLIDASPEHEKSMLNQKLDIASDKWFEVYKVKEPLMIKHEVLQKLSISYLVPILNNDEVELVFAIDFSMDKISEIDNVLSIIKSGIALILIIVSISLFTLIYQLYRYNKMKKTSFTDKLTNIYNRNYLYHIEKKIKLDDYILAVLDIDFFKKVNDTYGHDIGDDVLKKVGEILKNTLREDEDIAIRYGGEEFVVLVKSSAEHKKSSTVVVQRIFNTIKESKFYIDRQEYIKITASIGINENPGEYKNFKEAFKATDKALYEAKNSGRDTIKFV
jgi:diguanylate cyclase (GGDEF)-like protein